MAPSAASKWRSLFILAAKAFILFSQNIVLTDYKGTEAQELILMILLNFQVLDSLVGWKLKWQSVKCFQTDLHCSSPWVVLSFRESEDL